MNRVEKKFRWCLKKGEQGGKHRGLRKITPNKEESNEYIKKALHNLDAMVDFSERYSDWSISAAFYAMYHSLLAVLYKLGYESRNQECTINAVEYFIDKGILDIDKSLIEMVRSAKEIGLWDAKTLREDFQYGTETEAEETVLKDLMDNAKEFVERIQVALKGIG